MNPNSADNLHVSVKKFTRIMVVIAVGFVALYLFIFLQLKQTESQLTSYGNVTDSAIGNFLEKLPESDSVKVEKTVNGITFVVKGGEGSSLNADMLDSKNSDYFLNATNITEGTFGDSVFSAWKDLEAEGIVSGGKIKPEYLPVANGGVISTPSSQTTINWNNIQDRPTGLDDGDDTGTSLTESQVESYITNGSLDLAAGTTVNGNALATETWVTSQNYLTQVHYGQIGNVSGVYLNYAPNNTACTDGQTLKYDTGVNGWICGSDNGAGSVNWGDLGGTLTDQADLVSALNGKLNTDASFGGDVSGTHDAIVITDNSHSHDGSTISGLTAADFTSPNISQWTNDSGFITGLNHSQLTNGSGVFFDYRPDNVACTNNQVLKYDSGLNRWICGDDNGAGAISWGDITGAISSQTDLNTLLNEKLNTSTTFGGDLSGTYNAISVGDDSHNHTGATISGLSAADFTSTNISQWSNDAGYITNDTSIAKNEITNSGSLPFTWSTGELDSDVIIEGENISLLTNDSGFITGLNFSQVTNGGGIYLDYRPNNVACSEDQVLKYDAGLNRWECGDDTGGGSSSWGSITGALTDQTDLQNALDDKIDTSASFGGDVSGTYDTIAISNDSHDHTGATISGLGVVDFTSPNISQWTNDAGYITELNFSQVTNGTGVFLDYRPDNDACDHNQTLKYDAGLSRWVCGDDNGAGTISWGDIAGTLGDQSDLSAVLSSKLDLTEGFGGDVSGTYDTIAISNDSHDHTGATISGLAVEDFTSPNISQWTNDAGFLTAVSIGDITNATGEYFGYKPNDVACSDGQVLEYDASTENWICGDDNVGTGGGGGGVENQDASISALQFKVVNGGSLVKAPSTSQIGNIEVYQQTPNNGDAIQTTVNLEAGNYTFYVTGATGGHFGILDWSIDGEAPFLSQDWYGSLAYSIIKSGTVTILESGRHILKATVNGKNPSSSNYYFSLASVWFVADTQTTDTSSGGGGGDVTVGSMTGTTVFADNTADDDWLGLGTSAAKIEFDDQSTDEILLLNANVGIGTETPTRTLEIAKSTSSGADNVIPQVRVVNTNPTQENGTSAYNVSSLTVAAGNGAVEGWLSASYNSGGAVGSGVDFRIITDHSFNIWTNDTKRLTVKNDGKVGIGTTAPLSNLQVVLSDNEFAHFGNQVITSGHYSGISVGYGEVGPNYVKSAFVQEQIGDSAARGKIHILNNGDNDASNATLADARITIHYNGNVGIGQVNPNHKLDINGNLGIAEDGYINFGATDGETGYGIRDNNGVIEYKDAGGDWTPLSSGGGGGSGGGIVSITTLQTRDQGSYTAVNTGTGTEIEPLAISLTPKQAGNKIILEWTINGEAAQGASFVVTRNGTLLANATDVGNNRYANIATMPYDVDSNSTPDNFTVKIIDENSLDVATTYQLYVRSSYTDEPAFVLNRALGSSGTDNFETSLSTVVATEYDPSAFEVPTPGMNLIASYTVTDDAGDAAITFSDIPSYYNQLVVEFTGKGTAGSAQYLGLQFNNDSGNNYTWSVWNKWGNMNASNTSYIRIANPSGTNVGPTDAIQVTANISNVQSTHWKKSVTSTENDMPSLTESRHIGEWNSFSPITELKLLMASGNIADHSTVRLYGVR